MQKQSEAVSSGLLTVFIQHNSELKKAIVASREWCSKKLQLQVPVHCEISNYLFPDCKVIGGNKEVNNLRP
jgi:[acyl-carrier-protein] S-malonyltransferase